VAGSSLDSTTPFLTIWTRPRATIRSVVDSDPTRYVLLLAAIESASATLYVQKIMEQQAPTLHHPLAWYYLRGGLFVEWLVALCVPESISTSRPTQVMVLLALGAIFGIGWLYVLGTILKWTGRLFGGTATSLEARAAIAWGQIPTILAPAFGIFAFRPAPCSNCGLGFLLATGFGILVSWGFVSLIKCVAEVNRFSAWRGLGAVVLQSWIVALSPVAILFALHQIGGTR
jgi:hypothetical protein